MPLFRLTFADDGSELEVEADDYDDDGSQITLYRYEPYGADPVAPTTRKEIVAAFDRESLTGPPYPVA